MSRGWGTFMVAMAGVKGWLAATGKAGDYVEFPQEACFDIYREAFERLIAPHPLPWLLGDARISGAVLASLATVAFALAAAGYFGDTSWWPAMLLGGAIASLALMAVYFTRWWALGIVLSIGLAYYAVQEFTAA